MTPVPGSAARTRSRRAVGVRCPVGDDHHARVDRVADPDAAAVVDADPGRACRRVEKRVEDRPVGDRVRAVPHRLRLAVRRCDRPGVQVVPTDHDRRRDSPDADERVDREPALRAVAVAEPADPRRQPLERDPLRTPARATAGGARRRERASAARLSIDRDVRRITGEHRPPERPDAAAEERPDVGRDEARVCERVPQARRHRPHLAGCCHNRKRSTPSGRTRPSPERAPRSTADAQPEVLAPGRARADAAASSNGTSPGT